MTAQDDGAIVLRASEARLTGSAVCMNKDTNVAAYWKGPEDHAVGRFDVDRPAESDVLSVYGVPNDLGEQAFVMELDG